MRIALLHSRYARSGGVEKYIACLADRLLEAGHQVHYFSRPPPREAAPHPGLRFHPLFIPRWPETLKPLWFAYLARERVRREARRTPFDVVHGFSSTFEQDVYTDGSGAAVEVAAAGRSTLLPPRPLAAAGVRLGAPRRAAARYLEGRRMRSARLRRVLAMSALVRDQVLRHHSIPPERIEVLHPPVDAEEFHPRKRALFREEVRRAAGTPSGRAVLLFVGNGFQRKGLDLLLRALGGGPAGGWALWVLGRDRSLPRYGRLAQSLGVEARFLGSRAEVAPFYASADAFALPSRFDAFGMAALEAMAAGLPAIVSAHAGAGELVRDGENGLLLRDLSGPSELAARLSELSDPGLRARLGEEARATAGRYNWEDHLARVLCAYRSQPEAGSCAL